MRKPLVGSLVVVAALTSGCGLFDSGDKKTTFPAVNPAPVALTTKVTGEIHIGLIVSPNSPEGEGRDVAPLAEGAAVAAARFTEGGTKVVLDVKDDLGTAVGATKAVQELKAANVVGIVYASEGQHVLAGLKAAAGTPVLLPYAASLPSGTEGAWLTGPSSTQVVSALASRISQEKLAPAAVVSIGAPPAALTSLVGFAAKKTVVSSPAEITSVAPGSKSVVVWGSAVDSAGAVEKLQSLKSTTPVVLSPSALSSLFGGKLDADRKSGASTAAGRYLTAGLPTNLDSAKGVAFAAALRLVAQDATVLSVNNPARSFGDSGASLTADARSHDAVVALVRADGLATTHDAAGVLARLGTLTVADEVGLVGPSLLFAQRSAVPDGDVVALQSSVDPSTRQLVWFALPAVGTP